MHKVKQFQDISATLLKNKLFGWIGAFNSSTISSLALEETAEEGVIHIFNILRHLNTDTYECWNTLPWIWVSGHQNFNSVSAYMQVKIQSL